MPLTREQLDVLVPPDGWQWDTKPTLKTSGSIRSDENHGWSFHGAQARYARLASWAKQHDLGLKLIPTRQSRHADGRNGFIGLEHQGWYVYAPTVFKVVANAPQITEETFSEWKHERCGTVVEVCSTWCNGCARAVNCSSCERGYIALYEMHSPGSGRHSLYCAGCTTECDRSNCKRRIHPGANTKSCLVCDPQDLCAICMSYHPRARCLRVESADASRRMDRRIRATRDGPPSLTPPEVWVCTGCAAQFYCGKCKTHSWDERAIDGICAMCRDKKVESERVKYEEFDPSELPRDGTLVIPSTSFRPFRTISIEMEVNGQGPLLARTLYRCGHVPIPKVAGYQQYPNPEEMESYTSFLKHDGSVTGGELIIYLLNLDDPKHADALLDVCKKVHSLHAMKKITHDANCGGHIHIDAHNFNYADVWRLVTGFGYIEDPLYRIAGAGDPKGHRMLTPGHDVYNRGAGFSHSPVKGPFGSKGQLGQQIKAQNRMCGLNFTPYINAMMHCQCGALAYEDAKNCKCVLPKSTIEWRVFNSTHNPRILHAWIALMQALFAWSEGDVDPTPEWELQFPPLTWTRLPFSKLRSEQVDVTRERLQWMFANLPLTEGERDSLCYTIKQSDMAPLGNEFIDGLMNIPMVAEFPAKKPVRNPARRQRAIRIAPPAPGAKAGTVSTEERGPWREELTIDGLAQPSDPSRIDPPPPSPDMQARFLQEYITANVTGGGTIPRSRAAERARSLNRIYRSR